MEDTQRSQPISTEIQESAEHIARESKEICELSCEDNNLPILVQESSLARIKMLARNDPELVFTSLSHRIDLHLLKKSFRELRKDSASGVDKVTAVEYAKDLDKNLYNLFLRLRRGLYVATPVKRIWIEKENGKLRPIGITSLEDKIVQRAFVTLMEAIYEEDFYDFSHGFRKGHSQHQAIKELIGNCFKLNINWIVSVDITGLFDNIPKDVLVEIIKRRVNDGGMIQLVGKWLNAGVMEKKDLSYPEKGTPQGSVASPILSNIFLHHVLDDWFVKEVKPRMKGRTFIIRWADDFIIGCEAKSDADRIMEVLPKRVARFGLSINEEKSKLIPFGKPSRLSGSISGTFDFLGFTLYWGRSFKGFWTIMKKTVRKRLARFLKEQWKWCRDNRHEWIVDQHIKLCQKLNGYYQYFGVRCNYKAIETVYYHVKRAWRYWLGKRTQKGKIDWDKFNKILERLPLPKPRIVHNF